MNNSYSIIDHSVRKQTLETFMKGVFVVCGMVAIAAVFIISVYMIYSGTPAMFKIGLKDFLFGMEWAPTAKDPQYGILPMILTSLVGTGLTIALGVPIALMTAIFITEMANDKIANVMRPVIELLAGIPSVVYGLIGMILLVPLVSKLERLVYASDPTHIFTGGANMLSGILVLTIMVLPTIVNISISSIQAVPKRHKEVSLALGATQIQTIFKVIIPSAKQGITTGVVLGIGRALGEAMAILLVSGNVVNMPAIFNSVRFLTTGIVSEMSYASGLHREALFSIGLVLFIFIMVINIVLGAVLKKEEREK